MNIIPPVLKRHSLVRFRILVSTLLLSAMVARAGNPDGGLRIEVMAAYNLVVDSNVESPSTYAPRSAYFGAKYYNDTTNVMTNVYAYIGSYSGTTNTPGIYPARTHPPLVGFGANSNFFLTHEGDALGTGDATRYLGTLQPGDSEVVYWLVSYPNLDSRGISVTGGIQPDDDLWLEYNVWGSASRAGSNVLACTTNRVTMRNEISAAANKIFPNGANKVPQEYLDLLQIYQPSWTNTFADGSPGTTIVTEGIWYDLGNIGAGFDNNGDLVPDRNAWLQPVGDPTLFDASCFRLVHTYALVIVKLNDGTEALYSVEDQLYFENLPANNRGAVGYVRYEFQVLCGGGVSILSPYQEVASGSDNEKFNGDYGATLGGGLVSPTSRVVMAKDVDRAFASPGQTNTYTISYSNAGTVAVGAPESSLPLVITDTIPTGTLYVAGSAIASNVLPAGVSNYAVYYSTNSGGTWNSSEPAASNVTSVQWWLSDPLPTGAWGTVQFKLQVKTPYLPPSPLLVNTGELAIGRTSPFLTDTAETLITGTNRLGDTVWIDDGSGGGTFANQLKDGTEAGTSGAVVRLYYDLNTNNLYDTGDLFISAQSTDSNGVYLFTSLPDARYVAVVDPAYTNIPAGYTLTTPGYYGVDLDSGRTNANMVQVLTADFGFAPVLSMTKSLTPATNTLYESGTVTYSITVTNNLPGNGTGGGVPASYFTWAKDGTEAGSGGWLTASNAHSSAAGPDGLFASNKFSSANESLLESNFVMNVQPGLITNVQLVIAGYSTGTFNVKDTLEITVRRLSPATVALYVTNNCNNMNFVNGSKYITVTGVTAWSWADFATNYTVTLLANKGASPGTGWLGIDAIGFRITTDQTSPGADTFNTLNPVPLYDYYNTNQLRYVSSSPAVSGSFSSGSTGMLYWANLGPLYPGGARTVTSTFSVLEPLRNTNSVITNLAVITNATFTSGRPANTATSQVTTVVRPTGSIGDYVWRDVNADGTQAVTEVGIPNVRVTLTPPANVNLGNGLGAAITNITDANGFYLFDGLISTGNYTVAVLTNTLPGSGIGSTNTFDWDGNKNNSTTISNFNPAATNGLDEIRFVDFGYWVRTTIEGTIWHDYNRNATNYPDAGEEWLTNVTVYLYASTNLVSPIATNRTSTSGYFQFFGSYSGAYVVVVATNTGMMTNSTWIQSFDTDGTNTANQATVTVTLGGYGRTDYSYYRISNFDLGDTLFYDWDGNGVQSNAFEEGVRNVTVSLYEDINSNGVVDIASDAFIRSTSTDSNGYYLFTGLFTNTYLVIVDQSDPDFPSSVIPTADPWGALDGRSVVYLTATNLLQDFGWQPYGSGIIGDTVWRDLNGDGVQSGAQEAGISNITVQLYTDINGDGTYVLLRTTNTSSTGYYAFTSLPAGSYLVNVDTTDADLPNDTFGVNYRPTTVTNYVVALSGGQSSLTNDFGFAPRSAVGDTIFWDANENGIQDYSEGGIPGITLNLYNTNGTLIATTNTDANGKYFFAALLPDTYTVSVVYTGVLSGTYLSSDPDSNGYPYNDPLAEGYDGQTTVTLTRGQNFMGADFGYIPPGGAIGDLLWIDFNANGVLDSGENGIPFVTVRLYTNGTLLAETATDSDGYYIFYGLADTTYRVVVDTSSNFPSGLSQSYDADGTKDNQTTNIVLTGGTVVKIGGTTQTNGNLNVDFGYRYIGTNWLSGTVGLDATPVDGVLNGTNTSGVATNESAFSGVSIYAYLWMDNGNSVVDSGETILVNTTTTDINGDYSFTNLPLSSATNYYIVSLTAPISGLDLTTTTNSTGAAVLVETLNPQGYTVSAYQAFPVASVITRVDFAFISVATLDFGDLPHSYSTLLTSGARHTVKIVPDLYLGTNVTTESNGQPSTGADADTGDDGLSVVGVWQDGTGGGTVKVRVGQGSGYLVGFIDFSQDGSFNSASEVVITQAVSSVGGPASNGLYTFTFNVPAGTLSLTNTTVLYSRLRLFPSVPVFPTLAYQGAADNGEVEDYRLSFNVIAGTVYMDADINNAFSGGDSTLAGVIVTLYDDQTNLLASTVANINGYYNFIGLTNGNYHVQMTVPTNSNAILDADGAGNGNSRIDVTLLNSSALQRDFLLDTNASRASISGTVYEDDGYGVSGNGDFTGPDAAIPGVVVTLYRDIDGDGIADPNEEVTSTITDISGDYSFANLPNGNYLVVMTTPSGATSITDIDGNGNGSSQIAVALAGSNVIGRDFLVDGAEQYVSLSGLVWYDASRNGVRGTTETNYFSDITVYLYDAATNLVKTSTTGVAGAYSFTNVLPGTYFVRFVLTNADPALEISAANQGTNTTVNSDVINGSIDTFGDTALLTLLVGLNTEHIDLGLQPQSSTRADIADVRGEWRGAGGYVVWQTDSEWGTAGFFIYRIDPETGTETLLNSRLVASAFSTAGSLYELQDPQAVQNGTGIYRIEEVEVTGGLRDLGTHEVQFTIPPPVMPAFKAAFAALADEPVTGPALGSGQTLSPVLKVFVRNEGLYGVSLQSIAAGTGRSLEEVQELAGSGSLNVSAQGETVPVWFDVTNARLVFYGNPSTNWYAKDAAYLIEEGTGLAMARRTPNAASGETVLPAQIRFEQNRYALESALTRPEDFYYWDYIVSGNETMGQRNFAVNMSGFSGDNAVLTVRLQGWSDTQNNPDHLAEFYWNGNAAGFILFDGQEVADAVLTIPGATVLNGTNTLTVNGVLQPGRSHSFFVVDRIDAAFNRTVSPVTDGTASFRAGGAASVSAAAFTAPLAVALDETGTPVLIADENGELTSKAWNVLSENERFAVIESAGVPMLGTAPATADAWFMSATNRVDYLVIVSRALASAAQPLADYRTGQGLRTGVAIFEDICDLMTHGLRTPEAIPALLNYARNTWTESPWMVVLAGCGNFDYLGALSNEVNHLPPMLIDTLDGLFAADGLLTDLNGDDRSDIPVGRLPALTAAELTIMIDKIKAYEVGFGSDWQNGLVFAADTNDAAGNFSAVNAQLAALGGTEYPAEQIDLNTTALTLARSRLLARIQGGAGFVHYTGHGGVSAWSSKNLLKATDISTLNNSTRPTLVVALSCLVGRYESPAINGMGELLMRKAGGGAVAVWSPSGLSRNAPASELGEAFYNAVLKNGSGTLGLAILQSRSAVPDSLFTRDTYAMYNLLGDPALRIAGNTGGQSGDATFEQWRWQRFTPVELADPEFSGSAADPNGNGRKNILEYAIGEYPVGEGTGWSGLGRADNLSDDEKRVNIHWKQRRLAGGLEYQILVSSNLFDWVPAPTAMEVLSKRNLPDGEMEQVDAAIPFEKDSLFIKLNVIKK